MRGEDKAIVIAGWKSETQASWKPLVAVSLKILPVIFLLPRCFRNNIYIYVLQYYLVQYRLCDFSPLLLLYYYTVKSNITLHNNATFH